MLLTEDDEFMVRVYERAFKSAGFHLDIASDGEAAIDKLKSMSEKPDVVVLDIMMPKKTGFEVLEFMKNDKDLKNIPVVFLTNLFGQENEEKGLKLGAVAYMIKSQYTSMEIVQKIKDIYEKYHKK